MHLTFALIVCHFLAIVSAEPTNHRLIWQKSHRRRQISSVNSTIAVNSTQAPDKQASDIATPSVSSSQSTLAPALLPSLSRPASSSTPPSPPLGQESILPSVILAGNTTTPGSTAESAPDAPPGTAGASTQVAPNSNNTLDNGATIQAVPNSGNVQLPFVTGGLYLTAGTSGVLSAAGIEGPFVNSTAIGESSPTTVRIPLITGTGTGSYPTLAAGGWNSTGNDTVKNSTCGGCVVNAQAGLDWWYTMNVYQAIASISTIPMNGTTSYLMVPAQTTINVTKELWSNGATFLYTETFDETQNSTVGDYLFTTLPPPAAAITSITTISNVLPPPSGTFGLEVLESLNIDPGVPTFAIPGATGTLNIVSQPTNAVYYTAYEVESVQPSTE